MSYNNDNKASYVPPQYTPIDQNDPEHPQVPPPPPPGYPQYPPQYSHYPPPQEHYGYAPQPAAVVVGIATDEGEPQTHVAEQFADQLNRLPRRMWVAITKPDVGYYNGLKPYATVEMTFFILMIIILWSIILELIGFAIAHADGVGFAILAAIFGTLLFFFLANLLFHGIALCLGGGARYPDKTQLFVQLCFLTLLFSLPLDILGLLSFIPYIGGVIALLIFVYKIVLTVITLRAVYAIQTCHAIGILLVYLVAVFVVLLCFLLLVSYTYALVLLRAA